ncbi:hypothetical protein ZIOFF_015360 [Zingiber officinale]|uniref:Uncharacterized protein n=1 Tax=Zingiber officinale TaxID=94328 RepID=A0A8J5LTB4_ZINOF|nr:hypothetical protein ZIOFF_015360 [Zingiber officinale]
MSSYRPSFVEPQPPATTATTHRSPSPNGSSPSPQLVSFHSSSRRLPRGPLSAVAANSALLQALDGEPALHIVDVSNAFCTQWPTLLEALASLADVDASRVRLTIVRLMGVLL